MRYREVKEKWTGREKVHTEKIVLQILYIIPFQNINLIFLLPFLGRATCVRGIVNLLHDPLLFLLRFRSGTDILTFSFR